MEYYLRLSNDTIHWFLRVHHENMRPVIREKIRTVRQAGESFIFEGAALRPEYVADWEIGDALVVCFQVEDRILRERIMTESRYSEQDEQTKAAIEKFAERSLRENQAFAEASQRQGISLIDVTTPENADRATEELVLRLAGSSGPLSPSSRHPRHRWIGSAPGVRNAWPTWAASTSINDDDIPIIGRVEFR
ncbi:hypothetical protein AAFX91_32650 [Bradyrhizobium sp. 31Argb]|uniref:hypothetical protein n=1 Tax=unclassified Bradyrhizobium TaxID=2631580 RepID=UPI00102E4D74|nr:hypothetical protein [Bradyrhizobium sp. Leo170]TAI60358.1 hypothetical protein CWO89_41135 [Bradyrhizobium sp. Leo170]